MAITDKNPFDPNISSRKRNDNIPFTFDRGWSPVIVPYLMSNEVYFKLDSWIGGEGDEPFDPTLISYYLGEDGFVTDIEDALNIARDFLTKDLEDNLIDLTTIEIAFEVGTITITFDDLEGTEHTIEVDILSPDTLDVTTSPIVVGVNAINMGMTKQAISLSLDALKSYLIQNKTVNFDDTSTWETERGLSENTILETIVAAKARFNVNLVTLTTSLIEEVEANDLYGTENPYYAIVKTDDRLDGLNTDPCNIGGCTNNDNASTEKATPVPLQGCNCHAEVPLVAAQCTFEILTSHSVGDNIQLFMEDNLITYYVVQTGDTVNDVLQGLLDNLTTTGVCGGVSRECTGEIIGDTLVLTAITPGSQYNGLSHTVLPDTGQYSFTLTREGSDYSAPTYTGVDGEFIAWDGTEWYIINLFNNTFLGLIDTPDSYSGRGEYRLKTNSGETAVEFADDTFLNLNDTIDSYSGQGEYKLKINSGETEIESINDTFLNLNDITDSSYSGTTGYVPIVNIGESGLELTDPQTFIDDTFTGLSDTFEEYTFTSTFHPTSYGETLIVNDSTDGVDKMNTPWRVGYNGESATNDFVTLNDNEYIARPQKFQFYDDTTDTSGWGYEEAGRMKFTKDITGTVTTMTLHIWAINSSDGTYGWQEVYTTTYDSST